MNILIQWAIKTVLAWAYSLTPADLASAFALVRQAQEKLAGASSGEKRTWVQGRLAGLLGSRATGKSINLLIELAVAKLTAARK